MGSLSHRIVECNESQQTHINLMLFQNLNLIFVHCQLGCCTLQKPLLSEPQNSEYLFKKVLCDFLIIFHDSPALFSIIMKRKTFKISFNINI